MYADDTTLYFNLEDFPAQNRSMVINNELERVNTWLKLNKLTLNVEKTKVLFFINAVKLNIQSKIRLKYVFPKQILINLYKSPFTPHLNYGSLVWGTNTKQIEILQKRILRIITNSSYIAHTETILIELGLINVKYMFALKFFFLHKLSHNMLPPYFESYKPFLEKIVTPYFLRPHPFPLPPTSHVYAESGIIYQLVHMKNIISVNNKLIMQKIIEISHSLTGFSKYVTNIMLEKYKYECTKRICRTCGRL